MVSSESAMVTASPPQLSRDSRVSGKSSSLPYAYVSYGDHASWNICRTRIRAQSQRSGAASSAVEHRDAFMMFTKRRTFFRNVAQIESKLPDRPA